MLPLAAYADRMSVRPGETIAFKVSSADDAPYKARLVRVISADANPAGPGLVEEPVEAGFAGTHEGRFQPIHAGSYGIVEQGVDLGAKGSLSLIATIWPTRPGLEVSWCRTTRTGRLRRNVRGKSSMAQPSSVSSWPVAAPTRPATSCRFMMRSRPETPSRSAMRQMA